MNKFTRYYIFHFTIYSVFFNIINNPGNKAKISIISHNKTMNIISYRLIKGIKTFRKSSIASIKKTIHRLLKFAFIDGNFI